MPLQHDFVSADRIVGQQLLPEVAKLSRFLDDQLDAAEDVMQCCRMGRVSLVTQVGVVGLVGRVTMQLCSATFSLTCTVVYCQ